MNRARARVHFALDLIGGPTRGSLDLSAVLFRARSLFPTSSLFNNAVPAAHGKKE